MSAATPDLHPDGAAASLRAQQRALARRLTAPDDAATVDPGHDAHHWHAPAGQSPRVEIYRRAWQARLIAALRANFPVLHRLLGDETFADLAAGFMRAQPSRTPSIRWFGQGLPDWLASWAPDALPHPAVPDLARMEWALGLSFDAADAAPLTADTLRALAPRDWPALRCQPHPSVHLLNLTWAVEPLWRALQAADDASAEPPEAQAHALLVWRQGLETRWRSLDADEAALLRATLAGEPFAQVCARAEALQPGHGAARAAAWLRGWVEAGLLRAADGPDTPA